MERWEGVQEGVKEGETGREAKRQRVERGPLWPMTTQMWNSGPNEKMKNKMEKKSKIKTKVRQSMKFVLGGLQEGCCHTRRVYCVTNCAI